MAIKGLSPCRPKRAETKEGSYKDVDRGDTLWGIAKKHLQETTDSTTFTAKQIWGEVQRLTAINTIFNPNLISVGQRIFFSEKKPVKTDPVQPEPTQSQPIIETGSAVSLSNQTQALAESAEVYPYSLVAEGQVISYRDPTPSEHRWLMRRNRIVSRLFTVPEVAKYIHDFIASEIKLSGRETGLTDNEWSNLYRRMVSTDQRYVVVKGRINDAFPKDPQHPNQHILASTVSIGEGKTAIFVDTEFINALHEPHEFFTAAIKRMGRDPRDPRWISKHIWRVFAHERLHKDTEWIENGRWVTTIEDHSILDAIAMDIAETLDALDQRGELPDLSEGPVNTRVASL
ncbi:MAG: hypothetical protein A3I05_09750 [Deltaproteobacteria bacterium RIFCSPLOWO2_02_FULL_44_10]|nr:MAG: hypothetical protein A3C46_09435 [Deltaproteobacteria bacterium RIFCSPHIGHO2_02_FULL_44_16]OGQ44978.1 MAG: hypothetical protein A3I05_09750 [Deltaproteobacteria bacterium RIFCSPLOWO2_02_FULL_44_10]